MKETSRDLKGLNMAEYGAYSTSLHLGRSNNDYDG